VVFFAKGAQVLALLAFLVRVEARLLELVVRFWTYAISSGTEVWRSFTRAPA
jgi:hypothetical protein